MPVAAGAYVAAALAYHREREWHGEPDALGDTAVAPRSGQAAAVVAVSRVLVRCADGAARRGVQPRRDRRREPRPRRPGCGDRARGRAAHAAAVVPRSVDVDAARAARALR